MRSSPTTDAAQKRRRAFRPVGHPKAATSSESQSAICQFDLRRRNFVADMVRRSWQLQSWVEKTGVVLENLDFEGVKMCEIYCSTCSTMFFAVLYICGQNDFQTDCSFRCSVF